MRTKLMLMVLAVGGLLAVTDGATVMGDDPDQRTLAVTVYNGNLGLVKDQRPIELKRGVFTLPFKDVAAQIDPRHMSWYKRLTGRFGHAVVPVVNANCTGCFNAIPTSFVSKTNINKVQKCESCGRILYWP